MPIDQVEPPPSYQRIAPKVIVLQQRGFSDSLIGRRLGVSDKTVAKAIKWHSKHRGPQSQ